MILKAPKKPYASLGLCVEVRGDTELVKSFHAFLEKNWKPTIDWATPIVTGSTGPFWTIKVFSLGARDAIMRWLEEQHIEIDETGELAERYRRKE